MKSKTSIIKSNRGPLLPLVIEIRELVQSARKAASQNINTLQVATNFEIGRRIVEYEQEGSRRAEYGERILTELSHRLTEEIGRGFSTTNLKYMRLFYIEYQDSTPQIAQTLSAQLPAKVLTETPIGQTLSDLFIPRFTLSWSHYIFLMNIDNRNERRFYEIESGQNQWSLSELKRQFNSGIYERLALKCLARNLTWGLAHRGIGYSSGQKDKIFIISAIFFLYQFLVRLFPKQGTFCLFARTYVKYFHSYSVKR